MFVKETNPNLERVRFALRATGVRTESPDPQRSGIHSRGYLPHVKREGASYFVTFRLADSLPQEVLLKFQAERAERLRRLAAPLESSEHAAPQVSSPAESQEALDREYRRVGERQL